MSVAAVAEQPCHVEATTPRCPQRARGGGLDDNLEEDDDNTKAILRGA
jgi:hypothetical protein